MIAYDNQRNEREIIVNPAKIRYVKRIITRERVLGKEMEKKESLEALLLKQHHKSEEIAE